LGWSAIKKFRVLAEGNSSNARGQCRLIQMSPKLFAQASIPVARKTNADNSLFFFEKTIAAPD